MYSVVLLILVFCAASSWSYVPDYSIPLSSGSQTVEVPVNYCSTSLPSGALQFRFEFVEDWKCGWIVNGTTFNPPLLISNTETSIDVNVTTVCSGPIYVDCVINKNGVIDVISIEIKKCIYFLLYTCKFHVHHVSSSYSSDI